MQPVGEILFSEREPDLAQFLLLQAQRRLRKVLDGATEADFSRLTDADHLAHTLVQLRATPLRLDLARAAMRIDETKLAIEDGERRVETRAVVASRSIPYRGDARLWRLRPDMFDAHPPRANVTLEAIVIGVAAPLSRCARAKHALEDGLAVVAQYLAWHDAQIEAHNARLGEQLAPMIAEISDVRRARAPAGARSR